MKKNNILLVSILGILGLFLLGLAISYAFYSYSQNGNKNHSITTNGITFKYKEGTNSIGLSNAMPLTDEHAMIQENYFDFNISADTPEGIEIGYAITAKKTAGSADIDDAIKIGLSKVRKATHDIYGRKYYDYSLITIDECYDYKANYPNEKVNCETVTVANQSLTNPLYTLKVIKDSYTQTEAECKNSYYYNDFKFHNGTSECVYNSDTGNYDVHGNLGVFDTAQSCESYSEDSYDGNCEVLYQAGTPAPETYTRLSYFVREEFETMSGCQEFYSDTSYGECALKYRIGDISEEYSIGIYNYDELEQFENPDIDLSNNTEKLIHLDTVLDDSDYSQNYRLRIWIDDNVDFTLSKYQNATFSLTINVYSESMTHKILAPGLYDSEDNLIESYDNLVAKYNFDPSVNSENEYKLYYGSCFYSTDDWHSSTEISCDDVPSSIPWTVLMKEEYSEMSKLVFPNTVTSIGDYSFAGLTNLNYVKIPATVTSIGKSAFSDCGNLNLVRVGKHSNLASIGEGAFDDTEWLNSEKHKSDTVYLNGILVPEIPKSVI